MNVSTTMNIRTRDPGEFCWVNMLTPQPADACAFFGELLGWTYAEMPGMGYTILVNGSPIGGLFDVNGPGTPEGTKPILGVMVKVLSADDASAKVSELGGTARAPFDIMEQGRMAVCFDPLGAEFDVWQAKKGRGMDVDKNVQGAPSWFDTLTTDLAKTEKFYSALFGWTAERQAIPGVTYTVFKRGHEYVAGALHVTPDMHAQAKRWVTHFTVKDVEQSARTAQRLGGTLRTTVRNAGDFGRFCAITSPQGVPFAVIQYAR
jgi:uncharacterized protein